MQSSSIAREVPGGGEEPQAIFYILRKVIMDDARDKGAMIAESIAGKFDELVVGVFDLVVLVSEMLSSHAVGRF